MADKQDSVLKSIEETKAVYKRLGKSGLRVSVPILGTMSFGDPKWLSWVLDEEKVYMIRSFISGRGRNTNATT